MKEFIKTKEEFDRVIEVVYKGRRHDGTPADVEAVRDLEVCLYDPENMQPRIVQVRHAEDMIRRKKYVVGVPEKPKQKAKRQTKAQIKKEREQLEEAAGGVAKGALKAKE